MVALTQSSSVRISAETARVRSPLVTHIRPGEPKCSRLSDLWSYRYLLWIFVWRDIKVRYKQTLLGAAWAILQPLLTTLVFTFVFSRVAKLAPADAPYPVFVLSGLLPWQFFSYGLIRSSSSLVDSRYLLTKVPIPRLLLPVSAVLAGLPDFGVALGLLFCVMAYYQVWPSLHTLLLVPLILTVALASLCLGLFFAALNVRYRDVGYVIPFFTQLLFFLTPVAYPMELVPHGWEFLFHLNPMTGVVGAFHYAILGQSDQDWPAMARTLTSIGILLLTSFLYFRKTESAFADVV